MFKQGREGGRRARRNILLFLHAPSFLRAGGGEEPEVCSLGAGQGKRAHVSVQNHLDLHVCIEPSEQVSGFWSVTCYCVTAVLMEHVSLSSLRAASKQPKLFPAFNLHENIHLLNPANIGLRPESVYYN